MVSKENKKSKGIFNKLVIDGKLDSFNTDLRPVINEYDDPLILRDEENRAINKVLERVWERYNDDDNDILDREEMENFVYITLIENGIRKYETIDQLRVDENF